MKRLYDVIAVCKIGVTPLACTYDPAFELHTETKIMDAYLGKRAALYHELFLDKDRKWNARLVAALLNEVNGVEISNNAFNKQENYLLISFKSKETNIILLHLRLYTNGDIKVYGHRSFIAQYGEEFDSLEQRDADFQGRKLKKPKEYEVRYYSLNIPINRESTVALINSLPMLFYQKSDFLHSCHSFIKTFLGSQFVSLQKAADIEPLINYREYNIALKKDSRKINSLESFLNETKGYLHLMLIKNKAKSLQTITIDEIDYSIVNGIYISPFTQSLFCENKDIVDGLLMDTTWSVISKYVTSILMCASHNVGVPTSFAFGGAEDKELYSLFTSFIRKQTGVDISEYNVESDQGTALRAICDGFSKTHFACIRHFKVALKSSVFSFQVGNLISCCSEFEFESLKDLYSQACAK